jgi:hypothetical protein
MAPLKIEIGNINKINQLVVLKQNKKIIAIFIIPIGNEPREP